MLLYVEFFRRYGVLRTILKLKHDNEHNKGELNEIRWINWNSGGVCVDIDLFRTQSRALTSSKRRSKVGIFWICHLLETIVALESKYIRIVNWSILCRPLICWIVLCGDANGCWVPNWFELDAFDGHSHAYTISNQFRAYRICKCYCLRHDFDYILIWVPFDYMGVYRIFEWDSCAAFLMVTLARKNKNYAITPTHQTRILFFPPHEHIRIH